MRRVLNNSRLGSGEAASVLVPFFLFTLGRSWNSSRDVLFRDTAGLCQPRNELLLFLRLNAPAQVAATAICIQSEADSAFGAEEEERQKAPTRLRSSSKASAFALRQACWNPLSIISVDACYVNYRSSGNDGLEFPNPSGELVPSTSWYRFF